MALSADPNFQKLDQWYRANGSSLSMRAMFDSDPERFEKFSTTLKTDDGDLLLDFSKNLINQEVMEMLLTLAKSRGVEQAREQMFTGEKINFTEVLSFSHCRVQLGSPGSSWTHLGPAGLTWVQLGSPGSSWTHLGPAGLTWVHLDSPGSGCLFPNI
ncbi:glucose-6-phosphate isomerase isoform X2 [Austrofundulus limnaeus]|uniref:Glucose-6-phosphate isomerase isoform X2 n=1 Tax=Austrofundulus limnaeus TaxID=52670 RepID=A0A2I4DBZ7_AUSLI|nr:PREDICTED: glucose-6-phosphate isomerase-like isoform X2 [Austrofundulus limnaeus]